MATISEHRDKDGKLSSYNIRVFIGKDANGKNKIIRKTFAVSPTWSEETARKKAEKFAAEFEAECKNGEVSDSRYTFSQYADYVISLKQSEGVKASTVKNYRALAKNIYPEIGDIKLKDLKARDLNELYMKMAGADSVDRGARATMAEPLKDILKDKGMTMKKLSEISGVSLHAISDVANGRSTTSDSALAISKALNMSVVDLFQFTNQKKPMSPKTIRDHHVFISTVLDTAVREEVIPRNVAKNVKAPSGQKKDPNYFEMENLLTICEKAADEPLKWQTIVYIFATTGCRRGEIAGLKWEDIDFDKKKISIRNNLLYQPGKGLYLDTPKTENSVRDIAIPDGMVDLLNEYRIWQLEERLRLGAFFRDQGFVFTQDNGDPMHPDSITTWMHRFGDRIGIHVNPHAFRHSFASLLLREGVDLVTISRTLGHSNPSTTASFYSHLMEREDRTGSDIVGNVLFGEKKDSTGEQMKHGN